MADAHGHAEQADGKPAPVCRCSPSCCRARATSSPSRWRPTPRGIVLRFYFIAGLAPGTATIRVTEPSTGLVKAQTILLVEAGPARVELLYREPFSVERDPERARCCPRMAPRSCPSSRKVTDLTGMPLGGVELRIEVFDGNNGWVEVLDPVSDVQGRVEFSYHAGNQSGCAPARVHRRRIRSRRQAARSAHEDPRPGVLSYADPSFSRSR